MENCDVNLVYNEILIHIYLVNQINFGKDEYEIHFGPHKVRLNQKQLRELYERAEEMLRRFKPLEE